MAPLVDLGGWAEAKIQLFQNIVMLHIKLKGMRHGRKYFAHRHPPPRPLGGIKVKIQLFQNMVMLHIKLEGMKNAVTCKHMFYPYKHPRPLGWGQKVTSIFF